MILVQHYLIILRWFNEVSTVAGDHADHRLWHPRPVHEGLLAGTFRRGPSLMGFPTPLYTTPLGSPIIKAL